MEITVPDIVLAVLSISSASKKVPLTLVTNTSCTSTPSTVNFCTLSTFAAAPDNLPVISPANWSGLPLNGLVNLIEVS